MLGIILQPIVLVATAVKQKHVLLVTSLSTDVLIAYACIVDVSLRSQSLFSSLPGVL